MCREHHTHRTEANCYLCRIIAANVETDARDDDDA
jgi:hypothetical protein